MLVALVVLRALPGTAQENTIEIRFAEEPDRSTVLGAFASKGILYASLSDLAQVLRLTTYQNSAAGKLEIKQPPYRIKVTGSSPFVVVTDRAGRQTIYQLSHDVIFAAGSFFVPLEEFSPLMEPLLTTPASFDAAKRVLLIGGKALVRGPEIRTLIIERKANGHLIRIPSSKPLADYESWLRPDGWLYVTIADARADTAALNRIQPSGIVKKVIAIQSPTAVQLTFRLSGTVKTTEIVRDQGSNDLLISIHTEEGSAALARTQEQRTVANDLEQRRNRWKLDVIVIDAGHGGHDPGTIGVGGVKEKDVALAIALKLGRMIEANLKDVKVIYTRKTDSFVELYRRGQIANEADGKLFISIHANALKRKPSQTNGFEVYLLRPGRTEEAIAIAEQENKVIELEEGYENRYEELTEENFILVAMAQSAHMRASEQFADLTQQELEKLTGLQNRGVKQAGFYVLVGAAMPNVLIESGYLSNRSDERYLKSAKGQEKIANAVYRAIKRYKEEYEKLLMEGTDIGASR